MPRDVTVDDHVWRQLKRKLGRAVRDSHVKVGVLASKGGGEPNEAGVTMVELAAIHEFGAPAAGIPERSFIRRTMKNKKRAIGEVTAMLARKLLDQRGFTVRSALEVLGVFAATEVKKTITEGEHVPPPLAPATVAAKGSSRPLVDTGRLVGSINHEVVLK